MSAGKGIRTLEPTKGQDDLHPASIAGVPLMGLSPARLTKLCSKEKKLKTSLLSPHS